MSYAIIRNANYKRDNLPGLYKHNERKNTNYSNKDIKTILLIIIQLNNVILPIPKLLNN